jgi:cytochrome c-type biogenesis protein CcmH
LTLPILAGGFYLWLGSSQTASVQQESESGAIAVSESVEELVAQAEAHLRRKPEDSRGWEILAPVYMRLGRYSDSVAAWRNAALQPNATPILVNHSRQRRNGVVTAEAEAAFLRALTLDKTVVGARYYLGLAAEQDGDRNTAAKIWGELIAEAPAGAEWVADVQEALARVEGKQRRADSVERGL